MWVTSLAPRPIMVLPLLNPLLSRLTLIRSRLPPSPTPLPSQCALLISGPIHAKASHCPSFCKASPPGTCLARFPPLGRSSNVTPSLVPLWMPTSGRVHSHLLIDSALSSQGGPTPGQALCWELELHTHNCARGFQECGTQRMWLSEKSPPVKCQQAPGHGASLVRPFCGLFPLHL